MRILTLASELSALGGLERAQLQSCEALAARGHQIDLLYTETGDLQAAWTAITARVARARGYALYRRRPIHTARAVGATTRTIRRARADLVYIHHHRHALAASLASRPVLCHLHLPPPQNQSAQDRFALRRVTHFIAVSEHTAELWRRHLSLEEGRVTVIPNGVDLGRFSIVDEPARARIRQKLGLPTDRFLIAFAARLGPQKGLDVALEAVAGLEGENHHLVIAGEPNPADFSGDAAQGAAYLAGLRHRYEALPITWLGRLSDTRDLLAAADVVLLPSRFPDPMPLLVLECLASGTPIVASDVGGIPGVLGPELARNLVPAADPHALRARVESLRSWREDEPTLASVGRRRVENHFTLQRMGEQVDRQVRAVVASCGGPRSPR